MKLFASSNGLEGKTTYYATGWIAIVLVVCCLVAIFLVGCPSYNVWQQEMAGKAEFAKAEQNRRIRIEEAKANLEAEKLNAQAEVERAKGAAVKKKIKAECQCLRKSVSDCSN